MTVNFKNKNLTRNCLFWFVGRLRAWRKNRHNKSHKIFVNIKSRNYLVWQVFYEKWYYKMLFSIKFWTTFCYFVFFAVNRQVIIVVISKEQKNFLWISCWEKKIKISNNIYYFEISSSFFCWISLIQDKREGIASMTFKNNLTAEITGK